MTQLFSHPILHRLFSISAIKDTSILPSSTDQQNSDISPLFQVHLTLSNSTQSMSIYTYSSISTHTDSSNFSLSMSNYTYPIFHSPIQSTHISTQTISNSSIHIELYSTPFILLHSNESLHIFQHLPIPSNPIQSVLFYINSNTAVYIFHFTSNKFHLHCPIQLTQVHLQLTTSQSNPIQPIPIPTSSYPQILIFLLPSHTIHSPVPFHLTLYSFSRNNSLQAR